MRLVWGGKTQRNVEYLQTRKCAAGDSRLSLTDDGVRVRGAWKVVVIRGGTLEGPWTARLLIHTKKSRGSVLYFLMGKFLKQYFPKEYTSLSR